MSEYRAVDPDLVWALYQLGLVTDEQVQENSWRWDIENAHIEDLHKQSRAAYKALPRRKRLFIMDWLAWEARWRRENDTWDRAS